MANRTRRTAIIGAALACVAALALGSAGTARAGLIGTGCSDGTAVRPFANWLDLAQYELAPGGSFESGAPGWTLAGGAAVKSGNETFYVNSARDRYSLALPSGSSATTAPICLGLLRPTLRFFVTNGGSPSSSLRVSVVYRGLLGILGILDGGTVSGASDWKPSPTMIATLNAPLGTTSAQFVFRPTDNAGAWRIDDLFVDPWLNR